MLAFSGSPIYLPMCSRYSLTTPPEAVRATFAYRDTPNFPVRYNIAPTQDIGVVCLDADGQRRFRMMRWGLLPSFVRDPKSRSSNDQCARRRHIDQISLPQRLRRAALPRAC